MNGIRFEKAVLSDFHFAVQMSPKSNCIWTADNRMGGEVSCSYYVKFKGLNPRFHVFLFFHVC